MESGCSLLLVDDDDEFLEILVRRFTRRGMRVACATTAQGALDAAGGQSFHVAVIDRSLPDQDGVDLMVELRRRRPDLRVVLLSGHGDEPAISAARERGAFDYLVKPCSLATLESAIRRAYGSIVS
jgi:DNA-binding NtrC family response regulator